MHGVHDYEWLRAAGIGVRVYQHVGSRPGIAPEFHLDAVRANCAAVLAKVLGGVDENFDAPESADCDKVMPN